VIAASTPGEVEKAVNDLWQRQAQAYVLDLRNNFGGLLSAGVDIARLFLMEGVVMEHRYRDQDVEVFQVERPGPFVDLPLAVLVNENTASAAEIIAGALQVHQRAQIIGTPTYGKDTIQLVFELKDGSSLHVTSAQWWIPGLNPPIGESGLQPDIIVAQAPDPDQPDAVVKAAADALFR
jgi:carboxyl-terminal processing protease